MIHFVQYPLAKIFVQFHVQYHAKFETCAGGPMKERRWALAGAAGQQHRR